MNRLELRMRNTRLENRRCSPVFVMQVLFEVVERDLHLVRGWRNELRIARSRAPNPVLRSAELSGCLSSPAAVAHQHRMRLAEQPQCQRQTTGLNALGGMLERGNIVRNLQYVRDRRSGRLLILIREQVGECRLRPFDLAREHRLFSHIHIKEAVRIEQRGRTVQSAEGMSRVFGCVA